MLKEEEQQWFEHPDSYRILMDGRWELKDLYQIPHTFEQCYSFIYCFDASLGPISSDRIQFALQTYPWEGGYSYVNFYIVLRGQIDWRDRPRVAEISYASPGWMDLALNSDVAFEVAKSVGYFAAAGVALVKSYATIRRTLSNIKTEREKSKLTNLKLTVQQNEELKKLCHSHAKLLGFKSVEALYQATGSWEITSRLLLAHHRRIKELAEYIEEGKIGLPQNNDTEDG